MERLAKIFMNGRSQAVRLPAAFRFEGSAVYIRKDPGTGEVILSPRPTDFSAALAAIKGLEIPDGFLSEGERLQPELRDPFGWIDRLPPERPQTNRKAGARARR